MFIIIPCPSVTFMLCEIKINMINPDQIIVLIPKATVWTQQQEQEILKDGTPLSDSQLEDARKLSVENPEKVRLLCVDQIPLPEDPELKSANQLLKLITPETIGLTCQYGIFIKKDYWNHREPVAHELVHVSQYERFGNIQKFLNRYISECINPGYPNGPLEQEARNKVKLITTQCSGFRMLSKCQKY